MNRTAKIWDRFAKGYAKSPISNEAVYREKLAITRTYFTLESEVLEFGCGTGGTAVSHAPFVKRIHGIDASPKMLEFAKAKAVGFDNVTFECSNIEEFHQNAARYDVIMGHSILHLLDDKEAVIARVYDMLKPSGVFISSTIVSEKKKPLLAFALTIGRGLGLLPMVQFFSVTHLEESLTNAGFTIERSWLPEDSDAVFIVARK